MRKRTTPSASGAQGVVDHVENLGCIESTCEFTEPVVLGVAVVIAWHAVEGRGEFVESAGYVAQRPIVLVPGKLERAAAAKQVTYVDDELGGQGVDGGDRGGEDLGPASQQLLG